MSNKHNGIYDYKDSNLDISPLLDVRGNIRSLYIKGTPNKVYNANKKIIDEIIKLTNFLPENTHIKIRIYCIKNNISSIPKCGSCGIDLKYTPDNHFGRFCSQTCSTGKNSKKTKGNLVRIHNSLNKYKSKGINILTSIETLKDNFSEKTDLKIKCSCGNIFKRKKSWVNRNIEIAGLCDICMSKDNKNKLTKPVKSITNMLDIHNINYELEKTFDGCVNPKTNNKLRFDIYIPNKNVIIEYDGIHHYKPIYGEDILRESQFRDKIKDEYCKSNNIDLLRIPYDDNNPDATVLQYMGNKKYIYSWEDFEKDMRELVKLIGPDDEIYSIYRGSLIPGVYLTNKLNKKHLGIIQYQRYNGNDKTAKIISKINNIKYKKIWVIDDILETGVTMEKCIKLLAHRHRTCKIIPVTLFGRENNIGVKYINEHPGKWVVYPWE